MSRLSRLLTIRRKAVTFTAAISAAALLSTAPSASASTPLTGETLTGTGKASTSGGCTRPVSGSGTFSIPNGTATGPYAGTFSESGSFSFYGPNQPYYLRLSANFTIKSGATTITGSLSFKYPGAWIIGSPCGSPTFTNLPVNYSAVINGVTYQGTAKVNLAAATVASVTETFG